MLFRKIKEQEPRLGIAPLIDVVFLLLIFFMLTSLFDVGSVVVIRLPKVSQKAYDREDNKIILVIDKKGQTYLEGEIVNLKKLNLRLKSLAEKGHPINLVLEADKEVQHGKVIQIMDLAKRAGVSSIIIAARWEPEKVF